MSTKEKIVQSAGFNGQGNGQENYLAHLGGVICERRYVPREGGMTQFQVDTRIHELRVGLRGGRIYPPAYYREVWPLRRLRHRFDKSRARAASSV